MNIERLFTMHKRIASETTGSPEDFAGEFSIKRRQLQYLIEELRLSGAEIEYSRKRKTYFYVAPFDFFEKLDYTGIVKKMNKQFMIELLKVYFEKQNENETIG